MLDFLGRGSAFNFKEGCTSAYKILGDNLLLIDCGFDVSHKIINRLENEWKYIKRIFVLITHLHSDHSGSLPNLIEYEYWVRKNKVTVIYPKHEGMTKFLESQSITEDMYNLLTSIPIDNISLTTIETKDHCINGSFSYSIIIGDEKIYYSGDCADSWTKRNKLYIQELIAEGFIIYYDTCILQCDKNVHTNINTLKEIIPIDKRDQLYCMHFDTDKAMELAITYGFRIVDSEYLDGQEKPAFATRAMWTLKETVQKIDVMHPDGVLDNYTPPIGLKYKVSKKWDLNMSFEELIDYNKTCKLYINANHNYDCCNGILMMVSHPMATIPFSIEIGFREDGFMYEGDGWNLPVTGEIPIEDGLYILDKYRNLVKLKEEIRSVSSKTEYNFEDEINKIL